MIRSTTARVVLPAFFSAVALSLFFIQRPVLGVASSNLARTNGAPLSNAIGGLHGSDSALSSRQLASTDISNRFLEYGKSLAPSAGLTVDQTMPNCITSPTEMSSNTFGPGPGGTLDAILAATISATNASTAAYSAPPPPTYTVTIDVDSIPTGGGYVQVGCDHPSLINCASGWPFNLSFPSSGSLSQSFTVTAATVTTSQTVHIYACEEGGDITDPLDWRVVATITVVPN